MRALLAKRLFLRVHMLRKPESVQPDAGHKVCRRELLLWSSSIPAFEATTLNSSKSRVELVDVIEHIHHILQHPSVGVIRIREGIRKENRPRKLLDRKAAGREI